jgi:hypothetical protein
VTLKTLKMAYAQVSLRPRGSAGKGSYCPSWADSRALTCPRWAVTPHRLALQWSDCVRLTTAASMCRTASNAKRTLQYNAATSTMRFSTHRRHPQSITITTRQQTWQWPRNVVWIPNLRRLQSPTQFERQTSASCSNTWHSATPAPYRRHVPQQRWRPLPSCRQPACAASHATAERLPAVR